MPFLPPLHRRVRAAFATSVLGAGLFAVACDPQTPASVREDVSASPRIVSLSPALTQALIDLGMQQALVGRTPFAPPQVESVPVVGDLLNPDLERILAVDPDLLLVQPTASGVDPDLRQLATSQGWDLVDWRIDRLEDVRAILQEVPAILARHGADEAALQNSVNQWLARSERLLAPCPSIESAGRLLVLYGVDPPAAFGQETYVDDILQRLGATNALARPGYPELSLEDLMVLAPDTILILGDRARQDLLVSRFSGAADAPRVLGVEGDALLVPGTRLLDGVGSLRAVFECSIDDAREASP